MEPKPRVARLNRRQIRERFTCGEGHSAGGALLKSLPVKGEPGRRVNVVHSLYGLKAVWEFDYLRRYDPRVQSPGRVMLLFGAE